MKIAALSLRPGGFSDTTFLLAGCIKILFDVLDTKRTKEPLTGDITSELLLDSEYYNRFRFRVQIPNFWEVFGLQLLLYSI